MKSMDKLTTGVAYGTSAGSAGYWFLQLLDKVTPSQWAAIGVLGTGNNARRSLLVRLQRGCWQFQNIDASSQNKPG